LELLNHSHILAALPIETQQRLAHLEILDTVDSTNSYMYSHTDTAVPWACLAEYQTAGHGRHGRQWVSPYASGLCLSIKHHYTTLDKPMTGLGIALAVSVVQVLHDLGATEVGLKWPNDILWRGHKLAGLLLETRWNKDCEVVIGIGINVKIPSLDTTITQPWVDLYTVLGHCISRNVLAAKLIDKCCKTLILYPSQGLNTFLPLWQRFDLSYGQQVTLKIPFQKQKNPKRIANSNSQKMALTKPNATEEGEFITGTAWGIDEQGGLLLQVGSQRRRYICGEVSLRIE